MDYIHTHVHTNTHSFSVSYMDSSSALLKPEAIYVSITLLTGDMIKAILKKFHSQYPAYADGNCIQLPVRGSIKVIGSL